MGSFASILSCLRADLQRQAFLEGGYKELLLNQGTWATVVYRFGQLVYEFPRFPFSLPLRGVYRLASKGIEILTGIKLPASARIGPGLHIGHFGGIILHSDVVAGANLSLAHGVTIGTRGKGNSGVPVLGNNVFLGSGCKVLGPITVGDNASIGANAVVITDVPPGSTAVGIPARIVKKGEKGGSSRTRSPTRPKKLL